jgi:hypothetical protein
MTEIIRPSHSTNLLSSSTNHHRDRATMPLSGKQEDIRMRRVALSLAKHINWRTKKLEGKAYVRIAEELNTFWGYHLVMWLPSEENTSNQP